MPTLRPNNPQTESVVELRLDGQTLSLSLPEFHDEFRLLVRSLRYEWSPTARRWERRITVFNGPAEDRMIEAAYRLLEGGFCVDVPDAMPVERITAGEFADEQTRWVFRRTTGDYQGWFAIQWSKPDDFFRRAKRLPGARWSNGAIVVPPEQFEEVKDFAEFHGFRFSDAARQLLGEANQKKMEMVRVELKPRVKPELSVMSPLATSEIAEEFRDDQN